MKGFIEVEGLLSGTPTAEGFPMLVSVQEIAGVMGLEKVVEKRPDIVPCVGTKSVIIIGSKEEPICTSADYETVRSLIVAATR
jgi:hypothetical protein